MLSLGVDEVGRGCLAGPLVAGAVVLPANFRRPRAGSWLLTDSKLMTRQQRILADKKIRQKALAIGLGWVDAPIIDEIGLTRAVKLAMQQALLQIKCAFDEIVIDGNYNYLAENPLARPVIKADSSVPAVSAASIVAKVARDNFMIDMAREHPNYGFDQNVGYGTPFHLNRLKELGVCRLHRQTWQPVRLLLQPTLL